MVTVDPFAVKHYPRWHPFRLAHKSLSVRANGRPVGITVDMLCPRCSGKSRCPTLPEVDWDSTSVTPTQMRHLLRAISATESLADTVIVEVGCFRGVTTRCLAGATRRNLIAVNPYGGYGGADADREAFRRRTAGLGNVIHEAKTSGAAARAWEHGPASLVFIDAIHDYVNTSFDIEVWAPKLVRGGILALHDVNQETYAGTRRAAFEIARAVRARRPIPIILRSSSPAERPRHR